MKGQKWVSVQLEERETSLVHRAIGNYFYTAINMGHNTYKIIGKKPIDIEHSLNKDEALIDEVMRDVIGNDWRKYEEN